MTTHTDLTPQQQLSDRIDQKTAIVGVVGLGYVGLPLIHAFIDSGFQCLGFDVDQGKVDQLNQGESYIKHIESKLIGQWVQSKRLRPTSDMSMLAMADVILICVPTPLTSSRDPDLSYVESTTRTISAFLRPGQLVVLESTTYPTTTRDVIVPILSSSESELTCGEDFFVAYSPEREDPGNPDYTAARIPKVVGGINPASLDLACKLYLSAVVSVVPVESPEVAEACKILENTYRAVNIALVNELKLLLDRMGIDIWSVIRAAKTKPFGFQAFYPGPGLGGHCIPIDPFYLSWLARKQGLTTRFIELAGEVNQSMPRYVVNQVASFLNDRSKPIRGSKICVLGVAYKRDVDDPRESPSFELLKLLAEAGADLTYSDPHVPTLPSMRHYNLPTMNSVELTESFLGQQDCVLIATNHTAFDYEFIVRHSPLIVDTRNACQHITTGVDKIGKA